MVVNGSNGEKVFKYFGDVRRSTGLDFDMSDQPEGTGMVAIQGPKVIERLSSVFPTDLKSLKRYHFVSDSFMMMVKYTVFRSGYTGEDGVELIIPAKMAGMAIKMLAGKADKPDATVKPAGLVGRGTLGLESGMPSVGPGSDDVVE